MRKLHILLSAFLFIFCGLLPATADALRQEKFTSPSGAYIAVFTELEHRRYKKEEMLEDLRNVSHILYRVDFVLKGSVEPVATANHTDVYGWEAGGRPEKPSSIFRKLTWSPKEDFVIFPEEGWASAPGSTQSKVVALNPRLEWKTAEVSLGAVEWIDELSFITDYHFDCDYGILRFDGLAGKTASLKESESPIGYELVSLKDGKATIRMLLDNCRMQDIPPRCFVRDLETGDEDYVPCPTRKSAGRARN